MDSGPGQARTDATLDHTPGPADASLPATKTADYRPMSEPGIVIAGRYTLQEKIGEGGMGEVWVAKQTEPVKRKVALKLIKTGMDSKAVLAALRAGAAGAGDDGPSQHRQGARRRHDADRPAVLRHGAGQRPAADQVLRRGQAHARRAAGAVRADLPGGAARPPEGHRPSRPEAGQHPGHDDRRQAGAQGHRLRRGQGDRGQADRRIDVHAVRRGGRHAGIHVARAGGLLGRGHRHAGRTSTRWA